ncbi:PAS domain-containing protein [Alteromonas sp.]|nr:PAS domain-containing protein [Alteromonas sp.]
MISVADFFASLNYIFVRVDKTYVVKACNAFTANTSGASPQALIGTQLLDFFHNEDKDDLAYSIAYWRDNPESLPIHRWRKADGSYLWCQWQLVFEAEADELYFWGEDVSEQKRVQSALTALEKVTNTGYWEIDLDTGYLYWSDNVHHVHETDPQSFKPKLEDGINFYHPESIPTLLDALKELEHSGKGYSKDLRFITSKGKELIVNATGFSEIRHGRVVRNFGTFKDLTKQKEDELTRQRLEQRVVLALKVSKIGVWEFDLVENKLIWDDRLFEIYGKQRAAFEGKFEDWLTSLHPEDVASAKHAFAHAVASHTHFDNTFRVVTDSGDVRVVQGLATFIFDADNKPIKATGVNIDLTESEKIKNDLQATSKQAQLNALLAQEMAEKAKAADQQKSAFLANMSHEIRTPISGVMGLINLLITDLQTKELDDAKRRQYLKMMKSSSEHLLSIISDILDFSKIEAGKIAIQNQSFNFVEVTDSLIKDFAKQIEDKGVTFNYQCKDVSDRNLIGDPLRLKQVLYNLLGNAVKFTESGSITVRIHLANPDSEHSSFVCSISDTGVGIAEDQLDILFKPFEQADSSFARKAQGTGLGLSITAKLIELMHGTIKVKSKLGSGSKFVFTIPIQQAGDLEQKSTVIPTIKDINSKLLSTRTALVVEDNEINRVVITSLLSQLGIKSKTAENGKEALASLLSHNETTFDFILMDCQMPIMDGFETTLTIRSNEKFRQFANIPIIALTANAMVGDKEKCVAAGMSDYLSKPVTEETLRAMLTHWLTMG